MDHRRLRRGWRASALVVLLLAGLAAPGTRPAVAAAPALGGGFLAFWQAHNGALLFGAPLTGEIVTPGLTVQYFERARLEWHPAWPPGRQITLGRLGAELLGGRSWPPAADAGGADARLFAATGHSIRGEIRRFWEAEGGLPIFGYPLSEELREDGRTVQYFERARLEWHPELAGTGYGVLPTPLGALLAPAGAAPTVVLEPPVVQTGHTFLIKVPLPAGSTVTGTVDGVPLTFRCCVPVTTAGGAWQEAWALGGVEPELVAHPAALALALRAPDGSVTRLARSVGVQAYPFPLVRSAYPYSAPRPSAATANDESARLDALYTRRSGPPRWSGPWQSPLPLPLEVTAPFGQRRAYNGEPISVIHGGVDLAADTGMPIRAPAPGTVVLVAPLVERGNAVVVDHGAGVFTLYAHMSAFRVQVGQVVATGDVLGLIGSTGLATGPHLHWELHVSGATVDALEWLARSFP